MNSKGFTFIELIIVMAITGILATIAYASYVDFITRAHRTDGQSALLNLANRMELYYAEHNTYATATLGNKALGRAISPENIYVLSIIRATKKGYALQATPLGRQGIADTRCQSLTLNDIGQKGITTGPAGAPTGTETQCW